MKGRSILLVLALGTLGIAIWMVMVANSYRTNELAEIMERNGIEAQEILVDLMAGEDKWESLTEHNEDIIIDLEAAAEDLDPSLQLEAGAVVHYLESINDAIDAYQKAEAQYIAAMNAVSFDDKETIGALGLATYTYLEASKEIGDRLGGWKKNMLDFLKSGKCTRIAPKAYSHSLAGGALNVFASRQAKLQALLANQRNYLRLIYDNWSAVSFADGRFRTDDRELQSQLDECRRAKQKMGKVFSKSEVTVRNVDAIQSLTGK